MTTRVRSSVFLVIPTVGVLKDGVPTLAGMCRIEAGMRQVRSGEITDVLIIGGKYEDNVPSDAELYYRYIQKEYPDVLEMVNWIVDAQAFCTNRDLKLVKPVLHDLIKSRAELRASVQFRIVSYRYHAIRIEMILRKLGFYKFKRIESGESQCYPTVVEIAMNLLTRLDPFWDRFPANLLVSMANERAKCPPRQLRT